METLSDILNNKSFDLPQEVAAIKHFVFQSYHQDVTVSLKTNEIIISSRSAGLISTLRFNQVALAKAANTDKRIRFRIG